MDYKEAWEMGVECPACGCRRGKKVGISGGRWMFLRENWYHQCGNGDSRKHECIVIEEKNGSDQSA